MALRDAKTACKLAPLQPTAHYRAAKAHASLARWEDAAASIEIAARQLQPPPGCVPDDEEEHEENNQDVLKQIEATHAAKVDESRSHEVAANTVKEDNSTVPVVIKGTEDSVEPATATTGSGKLALHDVFRVDDEDNFFGSDSVFFVFFFRETFVSITKKYIYTSI